jgi:predicted DNA binding CopG/RHH family protein
MNEPIPEFKNEDEERAFWAAHDSSDYVDWSKSRRVLFPNLKPSTRAISLRLPASMLDELRQMANQRDVPYQSLIKVFLRERIDTEHQRNFAVSDGRAPYEVERKRAEGSRKKLP